MNARLTCLTGELSGIIHEVAEECVIGRDPGSQLVLSSEVVSAQHARIYAEGGTFYLRDLDSRNGTSVDGMVVSHPVRLGRLNVISIAETFDFVLHDPSVTADGEPSESSTRWPPMNPAPPVTSTRPVNGPSKNRKVYANTGVIPIWRLCG